MSHTARHTACYVGEVAHRRFTPAHAFKYPLFMVYIDLDELPGALDELPGWSASGPALAWFRRADHFGHPAVSLRQSLCRLAEQHGLTAPAGPIRLLTHLRYASLGFNPVSFYFCFAPESASAAADLSLGTNSKSAGGPGSLELIVAEVDNTPWGERHLYVLPVSAAEQTGGELRFEFPKAFHVSPFLPMTERYVWTFSAPGDSLTIHMTNIGATDRRPSFEARLTLARRELSASSSRELLRRFPLMTAQVLLAIYWNALTLYRKGARFFPHPPPPSPAPRARAAHQAASVTSSSAEPQRTPPALAHP